MSHTTLDAAVALREVAKHPKRFEDPAKLKTAAKRALALMAKVKKIGPDEWNKSAECKKLDLYAYQILSGNIPVTYSKSYLREQLCGLGVVTVSFSGSGDSGGVDSIDDKDGKEVTGIAHDVLEPVIYSIMDKCGANFNNEGGTGNMTINCVTGEGDCNLYHNIESHDGNSVTGTPDDVRELKSLAHLKKLKKKFPRAVRLLAEFSGYGSEQRLVSDDGRVVATVTEGEDELDTFVRDLSHLKSDDEYTRYSIVIDLKTYRFTSESSFTVTEPSNENDGTTFNLFEELSDV